MDPQKTPNRRRSTYRDSPGRVAPHDLESTPRYDGPAASHSPTRRPPRRPRQEAYIEPPTAGRGNMIPLTPATDLGRKKSLIRQDRNRIDQDHPNFHYRQHAQNMAIFPSTTGNDPIYEGHEEISDMADPKAFLRRKREDGSLGDPNAPGNRGPQLKESAAIGGGTRRLQRRTTRPGTKSLGDAEKRRRKSQDALRPPSLWNIYCSIITLWAPGPILARLGKPAKAQQRAWREKIGLVSIILMICAFVGFITFGFTQAVCDSGAIQFTANHVSTNYMIFHGLVYNMEKFRHPGADGVPAGSRPIYDLAHKYGGQDGSFLFQNVNGACKGLITSADNSDVPTDAQNNLAWYFPCVAFNQDGSSPVNTTIEYYLGYACHTVEIARTVFYQIMRSEGQVSFTWDDVNNSTRDLTVYGGNVLDLSLLDWFNSTQVNVDPSLRNLRKNPALRGKDLTRSFQTPELKQLGQCLTEITRVGSIDTESVGCIASQVVLYVSLVFILAIVLSKFFLALAFQWFFSRRFAASKSSMTADPKKRAQEIEDWTQDIYRPPPRMVDSSLAGRRGSLFLPKTSRFTSPYAASVSQSRPSPTTMASQSTGSRLIPPAPPFRHADESDPGFSSPGFESRSSLLVPSDVRHSTVLQDGDDGSAPKSFVHDAVVPQPPPDWEPFGYPLAHAICLVTAYSEGEEGLRTTLDSIATTDYPNSHKAILVICDGLIKGQGEILTTPEIALSMMQEFTTLPDEVQAFSYVAVASGSKRHNMAKIYSGYYNYGETSAIPPKNQQRVPMMVIVKCGTEDEAQMSKPGNRGKRDSQIILMSFLQKVMFDERMTELEFEMFNGLWRITGISPDFYEVVLMVDADTKVFPDSLTHMVSAMVKDPEIMGLCGETKIANKRRSWITAIQVFEYFISHHLSKSFESVFGGVTCLPGCFCMYRIKAPKGGQNYWVPILANPDVVEHYSENVVDTLHKKNLLLLGEDRYLSTLMLRTFPKRKQVFVPQAVCKTTVPEQFSVLLSQRRRWINSTVHNLMELVLVRDLCGTFCFSMQFVVFIELIGTLVLPAAIAFTFYLVASSIVHGVQSPIPLILLALILGLPAVLIVLTAQSWSYVLWMFIYLLSLPIWNLVLPAYAYWKFDDFSWGDTRKTAGEKTKKAGIEYQGEFDSSKITMKRWGDFEMERRQKNLASGWSQTTSVPARSWPAQSQYGSEM